ncbi:homocysteine S-methyltransferase [Microbacterium laevaniformans]|uniref:Homocysteine S-methyltransferase n=1 Tax=Microbacterium laevaniformans TaxID=36807 RepID=A0A4S2DCB8_9MICO|nr:homocysteine S-methyltransferase [Microbacterium laevaniformans]TGY38521.1 homocysteine S-methyltransferase [Microbacterium laevaniformans]
MAPSVDLRSALRDRPLVLDGGLGTLLESRGNDLSGHLWSARLLRDDPDEVRAAHAEFVDAGADVLVTSSYQLAYGIGMDDDEVDDLLRRSVALAKGAGDAFVAASVGPFGAVRADGSEYTGAYDVDVETLRTFHRRRLEVLADAGADALAIETIPSRLEVQALTAELDRLGRPDLPVWISLSAASSGFVGADLAAALADAAEVAGVVAVGVNCCPPEAVSPALAAVPSGVAGIAYPNSGERWDAEARTWVGEGGVPTALASAWIATGARLVGGCCRTTPAHIAALAASLR